MQHDMFCDEYIKYCKFQDINWSDGEEKRSGPERDKFWPRARRGSVLGTTVPLKMSFSLMGSLKALGAKVGAQGAAWGARQSNGGALGTPML